MANSVRDTRQQTYLFALETLFCYSFLFNFTAGKIWKLM